MPFLNFSKKFFKTKLRAGYSPQSGVGAKISKHGDRGIETIEAMTEARMTRAKPRFITVMLHEHHLNLAIRAVEKAKDKAHTAEWAKAYDRLLMELREARAIGLAKIKRGEHNDAE